MRSKKTFSILLLAIVAALPAFAIEPHSNCKALQDWAAELDKLPADYDSFTALEPGQRMAVYQRLSAAERANLWRRQMDLNLAAGGWNDEQRTLIAEARQLMTDGNFAALISPRTTVSGPVLAAFAKLEGRVAAAFPRAQASEVFYRLGPPPTVPLKDVSPVCNCSVVSNLGCDCQPVPCKLSSSGCGLGGYRMCDGFCNWAVAGSGA